MDKHTGWTVETLRAYILTLIDERDARYEERFISQEKAVGAALTAAKEAVDKAERAAAERFASVNEFRAQLTDQAATFMPRNEYTTAHEALESKLEAQATTLNNQVLTLERNTNARVGALERIRAALPVSVVAGLISGAAILVAAFKGK